MNTSIQNILHTFALAAKTDLRIAPDDTMEVKIVGRYLTLENSSDTFANVLYPDGELKTALLRGALPEEAGKGGSFRVKPLSPFCYIPCLQIVRASRRPAAKMDRADRARPVP
jgi:hypothetical protein